MGNFGKLVEASALMAALSGAGCTDPNPGLAENMDSGVATTDDVVTNHDTGTELDSFECPSMRESVTAICRATGARAMVGGPDHNCCPDGLIENGDCENLDNCHCCVPMDMVDAGGSEPDMAGAMLDAAGTTPDMSEETPDAANIVCGDMAIPGNSIEICPDIGVPDAAGSPPGDAFSAPPDAFEPYLPDAAVPPVPDAAVPVLDAAVPVLDAAVPPVLDAAVPVLDAAVPPVLDAAVPVLDAAVPPVLDAAVPVLDAAVPPVLDAAVPVLDAAVPPVLDAAVPVLDAAVPPVLDAAVPPVLDAAVPVLDAAVPPVLDAAVPPVLDAAVPPVLDAAVLIEICGDGLDNNQNGVADCDDPDCAQAPAVEVTVGRNGSVLTVFGQPPVSLIEPTTLELSCEHYNQGFALDFTLDRTPQNSQNLTEVRNHVNRRLGFWIFQANEAVQFHNGGQQPLRQPDLTIINGSYGPNGQSYEGHFPYQP